MKKILPLLFVAALTISGGERRGEVLFSHTGHLQMSNLITGGNLCITHAGSGTTVLNGALSYSGTTAVRNGTLLITGALNGATASASAAACLNWKSAARR